MQLRNLGSHGPGLSVVGVGAWAIGGPGPLGWGPQDDDESIAALHRAFDSGVNWVDTAAVYGLGHSEEVVGQVVREHGEGVLVCTKCGLNWYGGNERAPVNDLRPASVRFELEQSLKRLGRDHVDLYQFHWPDSSTGTRVDDLERCERVSHVDSLQAPVSLVNRRALRDLLPWCEAHGTGVLAYSPLQSGLLTGSFGAARVARLAPDDWRRSSRDFQEPRLAANLALAERLRPVAERHRVEVPAVAVAWVLGQPGVTAAIVGARRPSQLDAWLPAGTLRLGAADLEDVAAAVRETGAGRE